MDDLISRQAAIDAINKIAPVDTEYDCKLLDRIDVRYVLIELPSADRPQGEWIYCEDDEGQDGYRCSECGFFVPWYYDYEDSNYILDYKACPHCLARMKGADND